MSDISTFQSHCGDKFRSKVSDRSRQVSTRGARGDVQQLGCRRRIKIEKHSERKHLSLTLWESMNRRQEIAVDQGRMHV
jgi:hypothetical protein